MPVKISEKETRRDGDLLIIRNLKTGNVEDPAREEAKGWCPNTIETAVGRKCVKQPEVSGRIGHEHR